MLLLPIFDFFQKFRCLGVAFLPQGNRGQNNAVGKGGWYGCPKTCCLFPNEQSLSMDCFLVVIWKISNKKKSRSFGHGKVVGRRTPWSHFFRLPNNINVINTNPAPAGMSKKSCESATLGESSVINTELWTIQLVPAQTTEHLSCLS